MSPNSYNSDFGKAKVSRIKRIFSKLVSRKQKTKEIKGDYDYDHYEFDAIPDIRRQESRLSDKSIPNSDSETDLKDMKNESENVNFSTPNHEEKCDFTTDPNEDQDEEYNEAKFSSSDKKRKQEGFPKMPPDNGARSFSNQTNIVVNGGTGFHFGTVINNVNSMYYGNVQPSKQNNQIKKTPAIRDLLKCKDKVEPAHLDFLSKHFGSKWKEIGTTLGLSKGELLCIKERCSSSQEMAYQMLTVWRQHKGENATVGQLCKLLWEGNINSAMEAVQQLSENIENFQ